MMKRTHVVVAGLALAAVAGRVTAHDGNHHQPPVNLGDPIPGLTAEELAMFNAGKARFEHDFTVPEGVGPLFRATSCKECHSGPVTGGADPTGNTLNVTHYGIRATGNRFFQSFELGGPVKQHRTMAELPGGAGCDISPDVIPPLPGMITSSRHTPPVFGFGLIDAIEDRDIVALQGRKRWKDPSVIGAVNWGVELEALYRLQDFTFDPTRTQPVGAPRAGRFGWKSQTGTLFQFTTEPFNIELGISTPFFPRENTPDGAAVPTQCRLAGAQPNDTASQDSLLLYYFQAFLAPPPRGPITHQVRRGERLFKAVGCTDCHTAEFRTVKDYYAPWPDGTAHRVNALSDKRIAPYSDFLIHDMGPLMDDHRRMGRASGRFWRTTPLWGMRHKTALLHDGSTTSVEDAIAAHGGEGAASRDAYFALSASEQEAVDAFMNSL